MKLGCPSSIASSLRPSLTLIIVLIIISSPFLVLNPVLISAKSNSIDTSSQHSAFSLEDTSSAPRMSSSVPANVSPMDSDFTTQAPLQIPRTLQSTDLVNSLAFYEVTFITSTTGAIDKIEMAFPAGTGIGAAGLIERVGIGGGTLLKSGSTITYDLTTPVSIPAGTFIRLEMFGIKNPINPSTTFTAMITTRDSGGVPIDGPSQTNVYTIKKIVSSDIADGAILDTKIADSAVTTPKLDEESVTSNILDDGSVTFGKPAESFVKTVFLLDGMGGWNPNGVATVFEIAEPLAETSGVIVNVDSTVAADPVCSASQTFSGEIEVWCTSPPADGSTLLYTVINQPLS
jgi:hypothetical protein